MNASIILDGDVAIEVFVSFQCLLQTSYAY